MTLMTQVKSELAETEKRKGINQENGAKVYIDGGFDIYRPSSFDLIIV